MSETTEIKETNQQNKVLFWLTPELLKYYQGENSEQQLTNDNAAHLDDSHDIDKLRAEAHEEHGHSLDRFNEITSRYGADELIKPGDFIISRRVSVIKVSNDPEKDQLGKEYPPTNPKEGNLWERIFLESDKHNITSIKIQCIDEGLAQGVIFKHDGNGQLIICIPGCGVLAESLNQYADDIANLAWGLDVSKIILSAHESCGAVAVKLQQLAARDGVEVEITEERMSSVADEAVINLQMAITEYVINIKIIEAESTQEEAAFDPTVEIIGATALNLMKRPELLHNAMVTLVRTMVIAKNSVRRTFIHTGNFGAALGIPMFGISKIGPIKDVIQSIVLSVGKIAFGDHGMGADYYPIQLFYVLQWLKAGKMRLEN